MYLDLAVDSVRPHQKLKLTWTGSLGKCSLCARFFRFPTFSSLTWQWLRWWHITLGFNRALGKQTTPGLCRSCFNEWKYGGKGEIRKLRARPELWLYQGKSPLSAVHNHDPDDMDFGVWRRVILIYRALCSLPRRKPIKAETVHLGLMFVRLTHHGFSRQRICIVPSKRNSTWYVSANPHFVFYDSDTSQWRLTTCLRFTESASGLVVGLYLTLITTTCRAETQN